MQKGFTRIIILIVILMLAGLGGAYYFGKLPIKPTNNNIKACTQEAKICSDGTSVGRTGPNCEFSECVFRDATFYAPTTTPTTADETANWKTYINKDGGYSIKYPENTKIYINEAFSVDGIKTPLKNTVTLVSDVLPQTNTNFQMSINFQSSDIKTLEDFINQNNVCLSIQTNNGKTSALDGSQAMIFENTSCGVSGATLIYGINSGLGFIFTIDTRGNYNDIEKYIDQILSTFKFQ